VISGRLSDVGISIVKLPQITEGRAAQKHLM
jgi:hypothetical protein